MSADHGVINLDERDREPAGTRESRRPHPVEPKAILRLVAAFVVGVVLGGMGVAELQDSREQRAQAATVTLVAIAGSSGSGGVSSPGLVQLDGQLTMINAGPAPVTVRATRAQRPGVLVRDTGQSRSLRPGGTGGIDVRLQFQCSIAFTREPLSMQFSVETADEQIQDFSYPVALLGSAWHVFALRLCDHA